MTQDLARVGERNVGARHAGSLALALAVGAASTACGVVDSAIAVVSPGSGSQGSSTTTTSGKSDASAQLTSNLTDAEQALGKRQFGIAERAAKDALAIDPSNARAKAVLASIDKFAELHKAVREAFDLHDAGRCGEALPKLRGLEGNAEADAERVNAAVAECTEIAAIDDNKDDVQAVRGLWGLWWKSRSKELPHTFGKPLALKAAKAHLDRMDKAVGDQARIDQMYRGVDAPIRYMNTVHSLLSRDMVFKPQMEGMLAEFAKANGGFHVANGPSVTQLHKIWVEASKRNEGLAFWDEHLVKYGPGEDNGTERLVGILEAQWDKTLAPIYALPIIKLK